MELRIDITSEGAVNVIHVTGRLCKATVTRLIKTCDEIKGSFVLELSDLRSADTAGIDVIRTLGEKGAEIRGAIPFIQLLLDDLNRE
jgi:anti-anti-sigma regulatory factor